MYLFVGVESALLLDTGLDGMPEQYLVPYMDEIGLKPEKIRYVINSHADFDHTAGNASVRELCPQAVFMCHDLDRHMVEDIEAMIRLRYSDANRITVLVTETRSKSLFAIQRAISP